MSTTERLLQIEELMAELLHDRLSVAGHGHLEHALAHVREAYLAEDGQQPRTAGEVYKTLSIAHLMGRTLMEGQDERQ